MIPVTYAEVDDGGCSSSADDSGGWHVVLLVDSNERCHKTTKLMTHQQLVNDVNTHFDKFIDGENTAKTDNPTFPHCETRRLVAGDYLWIARHTRTGEERILDCIIERKSRCDLLRSLTTKSKTYAPLRRIDVQIEKLRVSEIPEQWLLVEDSDIFRLKKDHIVATVDFLKELSDGRTSIESRVKVKKTKNVFHTVQFLKDQHETMRKQIELAHQTARDKQVPDPSQYITDCKPFAPSKVGTMNDLNRVIQCGLKDPQFRYYLAIRRVDKIGEKVAKYVLQRFPTRDHLTFCLGAATKEKAMKELTSLKSVGKGLAGRIYEAFMCSTDDVCSNELLPARAPQVDTGISGSTLGTLAVVTPPTSQCHRTNRKRPRLKDGTSPIKTILSVSVDSDTSDDEELFRNPFERKQVHRDRISRNSPSSPAAVVDLSKTPPRPASNNDSFSRERIKRRLFPQKEGRKTTLPMGVEVIEVD